MADCWLSRAFHSTCLLLCPLLPAHQDMVGDGQQYLPRHQAQTVAFCALQGQRYCAELCITAGQPAQSEPSVKVVAC